MMQYSLSNVTWEKKLTDFAFDEFKRLTKWEWTKPRDLSEQSFLLCKILCKLLFNDLADAVDEEEKNMDLLYSEMSSHYCISVFPTLRKSFAGDFKVLRYLIDLMFSSLNDDLKPPHYDDLWELEEHPKDRFMGLTTHLLEEILSKEGANLASDITLAGLVQQLKNFQKMRYLLQLTTPIVDEKLSQIFSVWIESLAKALMIKLSNYQVSSCDDEIWTTLVEESCEILRWLEIKQYRLLGSSYHNLVVQLTEFYKKRTEYIQRSSWFFMSTNAYCNFNELENGLKQDLLRIKKWGENLFKAVFCGYLNEGLQERYLAVYQETRGQLDKWSAAAFTLRMKKAVELYEEKKQKKNLFFDEKIMYLKLDKLDNILFKLDKIRQEIQTEWLQEISQMPHLQWVHTLNESLYVLDHPVMQRLRQTRWIHATCFSYHRSEHLFEAEMEERNILASRKYFSDFYTLEQVYTMTDMLVDEVPRLLRDGRNLTLKVHPDRHQTLIARYCFEYLDDLTKKADKFSKIWQKSQFYKDTSNTAEPFEIPLPILDESGVPEFEPIEEPPALDLSVLYLYHQHYLENIKNRADVNKKPQRNVRDSGSVKWVCYDIYTGADRDELRMMWMNERRLYYVTKAGLEHIQDVKQQLEAELSRANEATLQLQHIRDEDQRRIEDESRRANEALQQMEEARLNLRQTAKSILLTLLRQQFPMGQDFLPSAIEAQLSSTANTALCIINGLDQKEIKSMIESILLQNDEFVRVRCYMQSQISLQTTASAFSLSFFKAADVGRKDALIDVTATADI